jgi:hypothetical protein
MKSPRKMNYALYAMGVILLLASGALLLLFDGSLLYLLGSLTGLASLDCLIRSRRSAAPRGGGFRLPLPKAVKISAIVLAVLALALSFLYSYAALGYEQAWPVYLFAGIVIVGTPVWAYTGSSFMWRRWR